MNESKCKLCDTDLVYVGSISRGGHLVCPRCTELDEREELETKLEHMAQHNAPSPAQLKKAGLGGSYLYANTQDEDDLPCEHCGAYHKLWESCPDDGVSSLTPCDGRKFSRKKYQRLFDALRGQK